MPVPVILSAGEVSLRGELDDTPTARQLAGRLPLTCAMSRWGQEYYGDCGLEADLSPDAREDMRVGELAYWPPGRALCVFFGPTPASSGEEPRAASPVDPVGRLLDDSSPLRRLGASIRLTLRRA